MKTVTRRRVWPWVLGAVVLFFVMVAVAGTAALALLVDPVREGLNITIDGDSFSLSQLDPEHGVLALLGVGVALLVVLVVVPIVVVLALSLGLLGAALGIGIALLAVVLAASPLWLMVLLLWLALRRKPAQTSAAA